MKKFLPVVLVLTLMMVCVTPVSASAKTADELRAQIEELLAQYEKLMQKERAGSSEIITTSTTLSTTPVLGNAPTCKVKANKKVYKAGEKMVIKWSSKNALYGKGLGGDKIDVKGVDRGTAPDTTKTYTYTFYGKEGGVVTCSVLVTVRDSKKGDNPSKPGTSTSKTLQAHIYEAKGSDHNFCYSKPGTVTVNVPAQSEPVTLYLSAYEGVHWVVKAEDGANITSVILGGYNPQTISGLSSNIPVTKKTFYDQSRTKSAGADSGQGAFIDTRNPEIIYHWAGNSTCADSSAKIPMEYRKYLVGTSEYSYGYKDGGTYAASEVTPR